MTTNPSSPEQAGIVERLREEAARWPADNQAHETFMRGTWDVWASYLREREHGSLARDQFENLIDGLHGLLSDAASALSASPDAGRVGELEAAEAKGYDDGLKYAADLAEKCAKKNIGYGDLVKILRALLRALPPPAPDGRDD
jgi:hypothetical protein